MAGSIRILVVDDDTTDRHLFRATLERGLSQVLIAEAENWTQLIDKLDDRPFDIILTDYQLRGFNGLDVIDEVRRRNCETPIIMVTGTGTEEIAIEAMQRGVHDYVLKSFKHIKRLPAMVESLIRHQSDNSKITTLRADNERFIGAFENAPYGVALIDDHGIIFQANQSISKILGYSNKALIGMKILAITHPDDVASTQRFHHGLFSKNIENYEHQKRYAHQKGYSVWTEEAASIVYDNQDQSHYVLLQIKDITERKRVNETLENIARGVSAATGEEFFRSLTHHLAKSLGTDYAFVCELIDEQCDQVRIIAASGASKVFDKMQCSVKGSPLEPILQQGLKTYRSNVRQQFQNFSPLTDLNIESLVGCRFVRL